jgi:DNA-binding NarL/FixJ family response regulator
MPSIRILIVDDMPQVRRDLRTALTLAGNIDLIGEAGDGAQAVEQERALTPDVVLMDLNMPVMDGYTATAKIKARRPDCRVIAFSVHGGEDDRLKAAQAGVDMFVIKGTSLQELFAAISTSGEPS